MKNSPPTKILIVTDAWHPQVNGVVQVYKYLSKSLKKKGYQVQVIGPSSFFWTIRCPGYNEIRFTIGPYRTLSKMISSFSPDILHIGTEGPLGVAARKYALRFGMPFTTFYHSNFPKYVALRASRYLPFLYDPIEHLSIKFIRWFHSRASRMFVATESLKKQLLDLNFTTPTRFMTPGIDHQVFHLEGKSDLFKDLKKPIALYVGRISIEKNIPAFLDMPWHGSKVVVGNGPNLKMLKRKYPHVVFYSKKMGEDLASYYRSADVFVFPSRSETFGIVLIEALACGLPCAGYRVTGPIDIITKKELGQVNDDLSIATKEALLHGNRLVCSTYAREHYSWEISTKQFLKGIVD